MVWSREHRAFVDEEFFKKGESIIATQRAFRTKYRLRSTDSVPDRKSILSWVHNFRTTSSTLGLKRKGSTKWKRTPENIARVRESIMQSPRRSARKHAAALQISQRTMTRILHCDLKLHPYKIAVVQELSPADWEKRRDCCNLILQVVPPNAVLWTSDEAHFHLSGCVNKQNCRYWAAEYPRELHERPLHSPKVTVWCAVSTISWPPRSPDLSPCDFFLWGYLKAEVFKHRPRTIEELKEAIVEEIAQIDDGMLARVMENFRERLQLCIAREGRHLDDIIFKS